MASVNELHRGDTAYLVNVRGIMGSNTIAPIGVEQAYDTNFLLAHSIDPASLSFEVTQVTVLDLTKKGRNAGTRVQTVFSTSDNSHPGDIDIISANFGNFALPGDPGDKIFDKLANAGITVVARRDGIHVVSLPKSDVSPDHARMELKQGLAMLENRLGENTYMRPHLFDWAANRVIGDPDAPDVIKDLLAIDHKEDTLKTSSGIPISIRIPNLVRTGNNFTQGKTDHLPPISGSLKRIVGISIPDSYYGIAVIPDLTGKGENVGYAGVVITQGRGPHFDAVLLSEHLTDTNKQKYIQSNALWQVHRILTDRLKPQVPRGIRT